MTQSTSRTAACACGQFSLSVSGEPALVSQCHCLACQRRTGSAFGVQGFFARSQVASPRGVSQVYRRAGDSGVAISFHFCPECGSTVFWEPDARPDMICIAVGAFADPGFPSPDRSIWSEHRHPWSAVPDVPTFPQAAT
jgi:hypothetical protein